MDAQKVLRDLLGRVETLEARVKELTSVPKKVGKAIKPEADAPVPSTSSAPVSKKYKGKKA